MAGITLGSRGPVTGVADITGNNLGKWTISFTPAVLAFTVPQVEVYRMSMQGAPGSTFTVAVENKIWATNVYGVQNDWEDVNSNLIIRRTETLYFYWSNIDTDGNPPVATIFLRYDPSIPGLLWAGPTLTLR